MFQRIKESNGYRKFSKNSGYILPGIILIFCITGGAYLASAEALDDFEKRFTATVAYVGLMFGVFQFWVSQINTKRRRMYDLRYAAIQDHIKMVTSITSFLNNEMLDETEPTDYYGRLSHLMNLGNEFERKLHYQNHSLFPGIQKKEDVKKLRESLTRVQTSTDVLSRNVAKLVRRGMDRTQYRLHKLVWHEEMRKELQVIYDCEHEFYDELQSYL